MIVDENQTNRSILFKYLTSWGFKPVEVSSVKDALNVLDGSVRENRRFGLILTRIQMKKYNGFDILRKIQSNEVFGNIPVIGMRSNGSLEDSSCVETKKFDEYINIPIRRSDLLAAIYSALGTPLEND